MTKGVLIGLNPPNRGDYQLWQDCTLEQEESFYGSQIAPISDDNNNDFFSNMEPPFGTRIGIMINHVTP